MKIVFSRNKSSIFNKKTGFRHTYLLNCQNFNEWFCRYRTRFLHNLHKINLKQGKIR
ncbi:hypothetical protein ANACOL_00710 [Anaerotruncus colihominis DSM 17241]|uniref:Uncharacterized protein n=1 Tax=Anaerotruncus colihominis DSM 17241 TaxID=445972 RepID=B0P7H9_9FIRM|nr:hypothetical protein ANACOL_00710 [Anaerotruncus colihominis DSM 17241]